MSKVQEKIYSEMQGELSARKNVLLKEKEQLQKAAARITEIDEEIAVIDSETAEYETAKAKLPKEASK